MVQSPWPAARRARSRSRAPSGSAATRCMPAASPITSSAGSSFDERVDERRPPLRIEQAHPAQVAGEVPLADEVGQHRLEERRREDVHRLAHRGEARDEVGGITR